MWVEYWAYTTGALSPVAGIVVVSIFGLALLAVGLWLFFQRSTEKAIVQVEDQGWFQATSYKPMQGQRVRRGTILGILLLAGAGIYTLLSHQVLRRGSENWELNVPFTGRVIVTDAGDAAGELERFGAKAKAEGGQFALDRYDFKQISERFDPATHVKILLHGDSKFTDGQIVSKSEFESTRKKIEADGGTAPSSFAPTPPSGTTEFASLRLLPSIQYTVPLLILAGSIWLAWRVVNLPIFADFLIATEAEINKVSWTTRKRLVQDTIVVLITVVLMAGFLFTADFVWTELLRSKVINVLQIPKQEAETTDLDRPLW
jgi:preprotein translocase SecE subunit